MGISEFASLTWQARIQEFSSGGIQPSEKNDIKQKKKKKKKKKKTTKGEREGNSVFILQYYGRNLI